MDPDPYIGTTFYFNAKPQIEDAPRGGNGSQVLPVAELSDDFEGDPEDGMQYLFLVRKEAATHARVYRARANPYAEVQDETRRVVPRRVHSSRPSEEWRNAFIEKFKQTRMRMAIPPPATSLPPIDSSSIPAPRQESSWRIFINGKRSKPTKPPALPPPSSITPQPPSQPTPTSQPSTEDSEMTDLESAKAAILASLELDTPDDEPTRSPPPIPTPPSPAPPAQTPEFDKLPQLPTPSLILSIPLPSLIHVLSHFNEWFTERLELYDQELNWVSSTIFAPPAVRRKPRVSKPNSNPSVGVKEKGSEKKRNAKAPLPTAHEVHWILSLLSRLNDLLDGDDLSNLRLLAKTVVEMVEASEKALEKSRGKAERTMEERREGDEEDEARARCWMVVAAIAGVWKQEDLWNVNL